MERNLRSEDMVEKKEDYIIVQQDCWNQGRLFLSGLFLEPKWDLWMFFQFGNSLLSARERSKVCCYVGDVVIWLVTADDFYFVSGKLNCIIREEIGEDMGIREGESKSTLNKLLRNNVSHKIVLIRGHSAKYQNSTRKYFSQIFFIYPNNFSAFQKTGCFIFYEKIRLTKKKFAKNWKFAFMYIHPINYRI